ncbi:MAG TPA: aldose 1-epimerase family protein [Anaeromyxobacter sp.]|nr:aldose 1-epimerase family protein [Anaeromyxobacter sp.]
MTETVVHLAKGQFGELERPVVESSPLRASAFRYSSGFEAVRLSNARGELVVLPYCGQMIWDARFDGVRLTMKSMFDMPRPASDIAGTYGCFAYHSGLLRNGCPSPQDSHPLHGEMPLAPMDTAELRVGQDAEGPYLKVTGTREYVMGFGAHYLARPSVTLRSESTLFDIAMEVKNVGGAPMDLMYMCHMNHAFVRGGRFIQPAPFTPEATRVRTAVPGHVPRTPRFDALLEELARNPAAMETLKDPEAYDPEQVFYISGLRTDPQGNTHLMLRRPEGDAFLVSYAPRSLPRLVRWVLYNADQQVAALALPSTCEPEGYLAEKRKGNVRSLPPGKSASFTVRTGYLDASAAGRMAEQIASL